MNFLSNLSEQRKPWLILAFSALVLELAALYFQYGLGLAPCIMCIYQRVAIWGIFFAGVVGAIGGYKLLLGRLVAFVLWGLGSIWGLMLAIEHIEIQNAASSPMSFLFSCDIVPNFPTWAPLHEWLPVLFEASGDCGEISWQFLGLNMPQWMVVSFAIYTALLALTLGARLLAKRSV